MRSRHYNSIAVEMPLIEQSGITSRRILHLALMLVIMATVVWFTIPVSFGHYNEGFQDVIVMNARAILSGDLRHVDLIYPLVNDFFLSSRFGVSLIIAGFLNMGLPPVMAFRLVMFTSLVVLVAANAFVLVRHYRLNPVVALLPALLFPGLFESAWFFNDNVLSAALSSFSLAVFWSYRGTLTTALAAVGLGLAIACRTDAVLVTPAFLVVMWFEMPTWRARLRCALVAVPLIVVVPLLIFAAYGLNLFDILNLTHRATVAWDRHTSITRLWHPILKGLSMPGMVMVALGAVSIIVRRQWREIFLCLGVPLLYAAAYGGLLSEVRYLLPLTPFIGILMLEGARSLISATPRLRAVGSAILAITVLAYFAPPLLLPSRLALMLSSDHDMPRPSIGRFWSPLLSIWWNRNLQKGFEAVTQAVDAAAEPGGFGIVVSTRWTPDRTVDLVLREQGFTATRAIVPVSCSEIGEVFTRGNAYLLHLRDHIPLFPSERSAVTWQSLGLPCLRDLGKAETDRILVIGETVLLDPIEGISAPGVEPIYVPNVDINRWSRDVVGKMDSYFVASAPISQVSRLLKRPQFDDTPLSEKPGDAEWAVSHRNLLQ